MAFEDAEIRSTLDAATPINGYRQDAAVGNVVGLALTNLVGTPSTFKWELIGRPAFGVAGGAGTNPWLLSTSSVASFTVDGDAVARRDGSYIVRCTLNESSPTQRVIEAAICRVSGQTIVGPAGAVDLRKPGPFETLLDTQAVAPANTGYAAQLEHWLEAVRVLIAAGPPGGSGTLAATYLAGAVTADQTLDLMDADGGAFIVDGTDAGFTGAFAQIIKHDALSALLLEAASGQIARAIATSNLNDIYHSWWVKDHLGVDQEAGRVGTWIDVEEGTFDAAGLDLRSESDIRFRIGVLAVAQISTLGGGNHLLEMGNQARLQGGTAVTADPFLSLNNQSGGQRLGSQTTFLPAIGLHADRTRDDPNAGYSWRSIFIDSHTLTFTGTGNTILQVQNMHLSAPNVTETGGNSFTVTDAANLYIAGPPVSISGNVTLTNAYSIWVDAGLVRLDGDGTNVLEVPDDTGAVGAHYGRIPINIAGVGQKFIEILS